MATMLKTPARVENPADWAVFACNTKAGGRAIVRTRLGNPALYAFALANHVARVRMTLAPEDVTDTGMPRSTGQLDEFEDRVVAALEKAGADTRQLAVVTADGYRDLFFASAEEGALRDALNASIGGYSFKLGLARIEGTGEALFTTLVPGR